MSFIASVLPAPDSPVMTMAEDKPFLNTNDQRKRFASHVRNKKRRGLCGRGREHMDSHNDVCICFLGDAKHVGRRTRRFIIGVLMQRADGLLLQGKLYTAE